jgi:hypothetical protein
MKIAVLENVSHLDDNFSDYLKQYHIEDDVIIVYGLAAKSKETKESKQLEVHNALSTCEMLCLSSSFADKDQMDTFVSMLSNYPNIKEIRILYLYSLPQPPENRKFLHFLNLEITRTTFLNILKLLETKVISEIFCLTTEQKQQYLHKHLFYFDVVPMYYSTKMDMIWHVRPPYIVLPGDDNYLSRQKNGSLTIAAEDIEIFREMMKEFRAATDDQLESCKAHDFGDSAILIPEKEAWLKILDKYKL